MNRMRARAFGALLLHVFPHALSKPVHWLISFDVPGAAVVAMHLLLDSAGIGLLLFTSARQAGIVACLSLREKESAVYRRILAASVRATTYTIALVTSVYPEFVVVLVHPFELDVLTVQQEPAVCVESDGTNPEPCLAGVHDRRL